MKRWLLILLALGIFGVPEMGAQKFARCQFCTRDTRGRISRSVRAKREFMRRNPCPVAQAPLPAPSGAHPRVGTLRCRGYRVDHIVPLACGGRDVPENMQWLTIAQHRAKTRRDAQCRK